MLKRRGQHWLVLLLFGAIVWFPSAKRGNGGLSRLLRTRCASCGGRYGLARNVGSFSLKLLPPISVL